LPPAPVPPVVVKRPLPRSVMVTGPVAFTVTVPPAPVPTRKPLPVSIPLRLAINAPLLIFRLPALTGMESPAPSAAVALEMRPRPNIVSRGVFTVRAPALPVPCVLAEIVLGLLIAILVWLASAPKRDNRSLRPEIDSCSDAVTDTVPPGPELKVEL